MRQDNEHLAELLRYIDEIDRRRLWAEAGYPSMFAFCVGRFHMSESMAGKRIGVARIARRYPVVFDMVGRGELHLSGIVCLKAHLSDANYAGLLAEAKHKTREEIQLLVARIAPRPDVPSRIRPLPRPALELTPAKPELEPTPTPASEADTAGEPASAPEPPPPPPPPLPPRAPDPKPLAPRRYALQVTIGEEGHRNLRTLQGLLAHPIPNGDPAAIVERALGCWSSRP